MLKKISAVICALSLSVSCMANFTVSANEADLTAEKEILRRLGIFNEERLTVNNFIYSLAGFIYDNPKSMGRAEDIGKMFGLTDENTNGNLSITLDEAIKYAVIIAGYETQISYGSDYKKIAAELGITKGITSDGTASMRNDDAVKLLYNLLDVEPMVRYSNGAEYGYKIATDKTLLSVNRKIVEVNGIMTANSMTSVYEAEGAGEENVEIGGVKYIVTDKSQNEYLGKNVTAYVQGDDSEDKTVLYVSEKKNKNDIVVIDGDDIEKVEPDFSKIEYIGENGRVGIAKLDEVPRVIYNGIYYGQYTADDLSPDIGNIELIDNDSDGKYEVINVTSYETMLVSYVDLEDKIIHNKLTFDGCIDELKLEIGSDKVYCSVYNVNGEVSLSGIKPGNVLSVARSKSNGDKIVKIYISGAERFEGTVTSLKYDEDSVRIDESEYDISDDFKKIVNAESIPFEVGRSFAFYIDYFGNVAYVDYLVNSDYKIVQKFRKDEDNEKVYAEFMSMDKEWSKAWLASKVILDGVSFTAEGVYNELKNYDPQIMILKFNSEGEIREIDTAYETMLHLEGDFTKTPEASYPYRLEPKSFGMEIFLENSAKLVVIPKDDINDKSKYSITNAVGSFSSNKSYSISAYDIDEYGFTDILVIKTDEEYEKSRLKNNMFVVTKVYESFVDGEIRPVIAGFMGEYKNMTVTGAKEGVYNGVEPGDVLNLSVNMLGEAVYVKKLISLEHFEPINVSTMYEYRVTIAGTIEKIDASKERARVNIGKSVVVKVGGNMNVCVYDPKTNTCENKTVSELNKGDRVLMKVEYGTVAEICSVK